jgi:hypothetical protein
MNAGQTAKPDQMVSVTPGKRLAARAVAPTVDSSLGAKLLPGVLSITAGPVDVISFLGLGRLFPAFIAGNPVVLAAHVVTGRAAPLASMVSLPVFIAVLGSEAFRGSLVRALPPVGVQRRLPGIDPVAGRGITG